MSNSERKNTTNSLVTPTFGAILEALTHLTAKAMQVPYILISAVDDSGNHRIASAYGLTTTEAESILGAISHGAAIIAKIEDKHQIFTSIPWIHDRGLTFLISAPICSSSGKILGTIIGMGSNPKQTFEDLLTSLSHATNQASQLLCMGKGITSPEHGNNASKMLASITKAQNRFIATGQISIVAQHILELLLEVSESEYGFIGERKLKNDGTPYLKTHAITNIAWNDETKAFYETYRDAGMEFLNMNTLFGAVLTGGEPVIANDPANDPRRGGLPKDHPAMHNFLGIPIKYQGLLIGMMGIANRPGGYNEAIVTYLEPLVVTCANMIIANQEATARTIAENEQKISSQKLARANADLVRSNDDLAQFAHVVSHDLQAPLRHIGSYIEILAENMESERNSEVTASIEIIKSSVQRLYSMIDDILKYARTGNTGFHKEKIDLAAAITKVSEQLATEIEITGAKIMAENLPCVYGDRSSLILVLQNLIQNAIKYNHPDTVPKIEITAKDFGEFIQISIGDSGVGVPDMFHDKVFKMFHRLPGSSKVSGSGIGLAICKKIVERHGGKIWLESKPSGGTVVNFTLPREGASQ